ncbi:MAG: hypothetical protein ACRCUP_05340 [Mycoplasmatales bacterium]
MNLHLFYLKNLIICYNLYMNYKKIFKNPLTVIIVGLLSVYILQYTFIPFYMTFKEAQVLKEELAEKEKKNRELKKIQNALEQGGEEEQKYIHEKFQLSERDEILFVFPNE